MTVKNYHIIITLASLLLFGCTRRPAGADAEVMEAAAQGDAVAQLKIGMAFDQEQAFEEAAQWYRKAAEQGLAEAQNNLGILLLQSGDTATAITWLQQAAAQGHDGSQRILDALRK